MKLTDGYKQFLIERLGARAKSLELSEKKGEISSAQQETLDSFRIAIAALSECWQERAEKAESVLRCKDIELAGAIERTRTLFKYKNEWADRARKAESQVADLEERLNSALITVARYSGPDAAPPKPVVLPEPYCVVCDYVYDAQELRDALDVAGVKWVRKGEADE